MKKLLSLVLSLCLLTPTVLITGCGRQQDNISKTGIYFDTVIQITLYDSKYETYLDGCFTLAQKYEDLFSTTKEGTDIWNINHSNGTAVTVADETIALLQKGLEYSEKSNGRFDITVGRLSSLWDFSETTDREVPSPEAIAAALATIDYHAVMIDGNQVTLTNPDAAIDLGGIAKGYIADQMKQYLNDHGVTSGLINLGGNVLSVGPKPGNPSYYQIAIQKPFSSDGEAAVSLQVTTQSVVTSGTYQRYFEADGTLYHHILDLSTGYPCNNGLDSVTIISDHSVDCDALSTLVFLMGADDGLEYVESLPNTEAVFLTSDGDILHTSGMGTTIPYTILQ